MTIEGGCKARTWGTRIALAAALLLGATTGHAAEDGMPGVSLRGFYTLNLSMARGDDVLYPPGGDGRTPATLEDGKPNLDFSLVGAQVDLTVTDWLRFTTQVVSGVQTGHHHRPVVDWAYLTLDLGNDLSMRGGRFKTPFLQGTELRHVGFSRLWVHPLVPNSGAGGLDVYKGLEFVKNTRLAPINLRLQGGLGVPEHERSENDGKDIAHFSILVERNESWIKFAALQGHYDIHSRHDGRLLKKKASLNMFSVETELWFDKLVVNGGYAKGLAEVAPDEAMRYLSLGYRHEAWTPYVLYQFREMLFSGSAAPRPRPPGPPGPPGPPPPPQPPARKGPHQTDAYALGVRYDLGTSQALKFQVERQYDNDRSRPAQEPSRTSATVFSLVFEGVF